VEKEDGEGGEEEGEEDDDDEDEDEESDNEDVFSDDEKDQDDEDVGDNDNEDDGSSEDDDDDGEYDDPSDVKSTVKVTAPDKLVEETQKEKKTRKKSSTTDDVLKIAKKNAKANKIKLPDYSVPTSLEVFQSLMKKSKSKDDALLYLSKIRTSNITSKKSLSRFADLIFEHIDHTCNEEKPTLQNINIFSSILLVLSEDVTSHITQTIQTKLKSMFKRISSCVKDKNYSHASPSLDELILLKVIDTVFPTSDLSHTITTPALLIVSFIFAKTKLVDGRSVACGIFLLDMVYNYVKLSKRYLPELILFLSRVLYEAVDVSDVSMNKFTSSAVNVHKTENGALYIGVNMEDNVEVQPMNISVLSKYSEGSETTTTTFKLSCVRNLLLVCQKFAKLYSELETFSELIEPIAVLLRHLPLYNYPISLKKLHSNVTETIASKSGREKVALKLQARKPIPLTLLEPQYDDDATDVFRKRGSGDKAKNEYDKLKYKVKREMKGAVKEIRKDSQFLAKQQLGEQLSKDVTRKRKVKELTNHLENERREIKELERGSKKSK